MTPSGLLIRDQRLGADVPRVMGVLNATPDSFHTGSRVTNDAVAKYACDMVSQGASLLDLGGQSSRPGAVLVGAQEEWRRIQPALEAIRTALPDVPISIDTFHSDVARKAIECGADMVNDISAGTLDPELPLVVAECGVPYAIMHMKGLPETMQDRPNYGNVVKEVYGYLEERCEEFRELGIRQLMVDPGFGFGKHIKHNYQLLQHLSVFAELGHPVLAGVSRKSMIHKVLDCTSAEALNGTTALHAWALERGVHWLRVHDVRPAVECIRLHQYLRAAASEWNDD
ncbi:MAG: dihydropteroate synthase [Crocinitomicaceae bacterium]|nr:dihydropteroate synthase [Crocinitomicaceae bacterium]